MSQLEPPFVRCVYCDLPSYSAVESEQQLCDDCRYFLATHPKERAEWKQSGTERKVTHDE